MYMLLIILLMLSQDTAFAQNVHKIVLQVSDSSCYAVVQRWCRGEGPASVCSQACLASSSTLGSSLPHLAAPQSVPFYRERSTRTTLGSLLVVLLLRCAWCRLRLAAGRWPRSVLFWHWL